MKIFEDLKILRRNLVLKHFEILGLVGLGWYKKKIEFLK
jgi:hypothetical protein